MPPYDLEVVEHLMENNTLPELRCLLLNQGVCEKLSKESSIPPHILRASAVEAIRRLEEGAI